MTLYQLALLGTPTPEQAATLTATLSVMVAPFDLAINREISLAMGAENFDPDPRYPATAVYFGHNPPDTTSIDRLAALGVPIVPVVSDLAQFAAETPPSLRHLNGLALSNLDEELRELAAVLLECAGLMPRQRRIFLSYRRDEAREAAVQLFEALAKRHFDVFLDTHGVPPAVDFQETLWQRLCDSDVLVMLDTPGYFQSRWTELEFASALAKSIVVLRMGWPGHPINARARLARDLPLEPGDFQTPGGRLTENTVQRLCAELEAARSQSIARRHGEILNATRLALRKIGGDLEAVGPGRSMLARLPDGRVVAAHPAVGIPSAMSLYDACQASRGRDTAVVYDDAGVSPKWQAHLDWLGGHIGMARWIRSGRAAWDFAQWVR